MKKVLLSLCLMLGVGISAVAQDRTITGQVISASDEFPLPGVNVTVKGTSQGTITDQNGNYSLAVPANAEALVFSFIGFVSTEQNIGSRSVIDVRLMDDITELTELVVVGYGTQTKRDVTGSISSVSGKDIERLPVASVDQALQGRAAGVFVTTPSGTPGAGINMQIRGNTSLSASSQPLYVIDGIPMIAEDLSALFSGGQSTNSLADINPNDIESIEVLKDASASAIYGSRAANGVVLITTKRGKKGQSNIDVNAYYGFQDVTRRIPMHSSQEFLELMNDAIRQDARAGNEYWYENITDAWGFDPEDPDLQNTRWFDEIFNTAPIMNYDISARGGTEKTKYYTSLSYFNQEGVQIGTGFERVSGRINLDTEINDWLTVGTSMNVSRTVQDRAINDNSLYGVVINTLAGDPLMPVFEEDGGYADPFDYFGWWMLDNPVLIGNEYSRFTRTVRGLGTIYAEADIAPGLKFRSTASIDYMNLDDEAFTPSFARESVNRQANGFGNFALTQDFTWLTENYLSYSKSFAGKHSLNAILGTSYQASNRNFASINAERFPNDQFTKLSVAALTTSASTSGTNWGIASYYTRVNYSFDDQFLVTGTVRADGSSRFGADTRFGVFPSGSAAWRMSEAGFFPEQSTVSDLKIRASYGVIGNQDGIGNFASRGLWGVGNYRQQASLLPIQLQNPMLTWESTAQTDIGIDIGLFNNRVTIVADVFEKITENLLQNRLVPGVSGYRNVTENIGSVRNWGWEFAVDAVILEGPLTWSSSLNISQVRNEVLSLVVDRDIISDSHILAEGHPIGTFFLIRHEGVDPQTGDIIWDDLNGDGVINSADRQIVGNALPDFFGGWNNNLSYKGWDLNVFWQFTYGNMVFNHSRASYENLGFSRIGAGFPLPDGNNHQLADTRWMEPGDISDIPRASIQQDNWREYSTRWLEDASFLRLKTVNLGYNFPNTLTNRIGLRSLRVYAQGQNLLTFTNYTGFDPEVNQNARDPRFAGRDFGTLPQLRSVSLGFNIGL